MTRLLIVLLSLIALPAWADTHTFTTAAGTDLAICESNNDPSYPPPFLGCVDSVTFYVAKDHHGNGDNYIGNGLMRWDTSLLSGASITSATLDVCFYQNSTSNEDNRSFACEWYNPDWGPGSGDYTAGSSGTALSVSLASINQATPPCTTNTFTLSAPTSISETGFTALRCTISGGQPGGFNDVNFVGAEDLVRAPKLNVVFAPGATFTPTATVTGTPPTATPTRTPTPTPTCFGFIDIPATNSGACRGNGAIGSAPPFTACGGTLAAGWDHVRCPPSDALCKLQCDAGGFTITQEEWGIGLLRWVVPPLPLGATLVSPNFHFLVSPGSEEDNLNGWAEWYHDWTPPGGASDYSTTPSNSAFDIGPLLALNPALCTSGVCTVPINDISQIPLDGGVIALRIYLSSTAITGCNGWDMTASALRAGYVFPCGAETPTPGTPTATPTTVPVTPTSTPPPTNSFTVTPTTTATPTGTPPTATPTPTPNPQFGCCACPNMCSSAFTQAACVVPCTFGGPGTICVEVNE